MRNVTMKTPGHWRSLSVAALLIVYGCGGGSGATTQSNPTTTTPDVSNYNGPPPATADVQSFKLNVWDSLVPNNRCGSCHNETQSPRFVRADDINLAYEVANTLVDFGDPGQSRLVTKVRGGHNCWLSDNNACGDIMQSYIEAWAGESVGGDGKTIQLTAPPIKDPGSSKNFPSSSASFTGAGSIHEALTLYCTGCHTDAAAVPQQPYFASMDADVAYEAAQAKIDLDDAANSRLVLRLGDEFHNCWSDCQVNAADMQARIQAFSDSITPTQIDAQLVTSKALNLTDGIIASSGGRHETNVIALYEFKTGTGTTAFDTSGVEPSLNLTMSGTVNWMGGWGAQIMADGRLQGSTTASKKLHDLIKATNEYSVEAWVAPSNVTQDGPAVIVGYSGGPLNRNFVLGQTLYDYNFLNRTDQSDQAGQPMVSTPSADEVLQATQQHIVVTYDPTNGRRIFVNGIEEGDPDPATPGLLTDWDDTFALVVGSGVDGDNLWAGTVRLLAIHNRALSDTQVQENYDAGVGEKSYLLFNVADHTGIADSYVVFLVEQYDSYSYLFRDPFFAILGSQTPGSIPLQKVRIGLNGRELLSGQTYKNLDLMLNDVDYAAGDGFQYLSPLGAVVPLEKGTASDEFFLTFEVLGSSTNPVTEPDPAPPATPPDVPRGDTMGIRDFAEINATLSKVTGVPTTDAGVGSTYSLVFQALPVNTDLAGFLSSQQMGITQLAIAYCDALIDDTTARASYFPNLNFAAAPATAYADTSVIIDPLIANMVGAGLSSQPDIASELDALIGRLLSGSANTAGVAKGTCAAAVGGATMLVQ